MYTYEVQNKIHKMIIVHIFFFTKRMYIHICHYETNYHKLSNLLRYLAMSSTANRKAMRAISFTFLFSRYMSDAWKKNNMCYLARFFYSLARSLSRYIHMGSRIYISVSSKQINSFTTVYVIILYSRDWPIRLLLMFFCVALYHRNVWK